MFLITLAFLLGTLIICDGLAHLYRDYEVNSLTVREVRLPAEDHLTPAWIFYETDGFFGGFTMAHLLDGQWREWPGPVTQLISPHISRRLDAILEEHRYLEER